ncbi:MAG: XdhC family protein [Pseudomonadota bacterium]
MSRPADPTLEHPLDVMRAALAVMDAGRPCALAFMVGAEGGAVRRPGAVMAVADDGRVWGYLSGGCIDADIALQARETLRDNGVRTLRYGAGSPFLDISLPCGGAIEILITPIPDRSALITVCETLEARATATLGVDPNGRINAADAENSEHQTFCYTPKLRLRIAGRGADLVALARIAAISGLPCLVQSPDDDCLAAAKASGVDDLERLIAPNDRIVLKDDAWTAFALMFHDPDWETALLLDALSGPAFFVGAVGSRRTQARRHADLIDAGCAPEHLARLRGPIGLVPRMRDASMLAVSALAEIVAAFHARP